MAHRRPHLRRLNEGNHSPRVTSRRIAWSLAAVGFVAIAVYGVYLSLTAASRPSRVTATAPNEGIVNGFQVNVTAVQRDGVDPDLSLPPATHLVRVQLTFENTSTSQQRADPADFRLRDVSAGADHQPAYANKGDCRRWQRVDLYPPKGDGGPLRDSDARKSGPTVGPLSLCFELPNSDVPLVLLWSPDVGLLGNTVTIPLRRH